MSPVSSPPSDYSADHSTIPSDAVHQSADWSVGSIVKVTWLLQHRDHVEITTRAGHTITGHVEATATYQNADGTTGSTTDARPPRVRDVRLCLDARHPNWETTGATLLAPISFSQRSPNVIGSVSTPILKQADHVPSDRDGLVADITILASGLPDTRHPATPSLVGRFEDTAHETATLLVLQPTGHVTSHTLPTPDHGLTSSTADETMSLVTARRRYEAGRYAPTDERSLLIAEYL
jgi:hypothetical protein